MNGPTTSECLICSEPAFASLDNKLLTSSQCGHKVCRRCLQFNQQRHQNELPADHPTESTTHSAIEKNDARSDAQNDVKTARPPRGWVQVLTCPLCQTVTAAEDWLDRGTEETLFEQEKIVRQRVLAVYNSTRLNFDATPLYNDYLEKREETIFELSFGTDESQRKALQEELQSAETENQKQIVECRQKALATEQQEIRDIVQKEGIFYEIVGQNFGPGFRYHHTAGGDVALVHPLQRSHPELFATEDAESVTAAKSAVLSSQLGAGGQPKPIQSGLTYDKVAKRQPTDKAAYLRACGLFKEQIGRRVTQELWGGLEFQVVH